MTTSVLIVDDSRVIRRIIRNTLAATDMFDVFHEAVDGRHAMEIAVSQPVDLVLCDLDMPRLDGYGLLAELRADARFARVPVLMLSSNAATDNKVKGFACGATDYIVKPCDPAELVARVRSYLQIQSLQDALRAKVEQLALANEALSQMAITDALTGLHNRRHFTDRANEELRRAQRHDRAFGVLLLDVDRFKSINDSKGHAQGDAVLVAIARALKQSLRASDIVARYGGEEFVVCAPETSAESAVVVAEKLRHAIEIAPIAGMDASVTASIGVCAYPAHGMHSLDAILRAADTALYRAKALGRNRVEVAELSAARSLMPRPAA